MACDHSESTSNSNSLDRANCDVHVVLCEVANGLTRRDTSTDDGNVVVALVAVDGIVLRIKVQVLQVVSPESKTIRLGASPEVVVATVLDGEADIVVLDELESRNDIGLTACRNIVCGETPKVTNSVR